VDGLSLDGLCGDAPCGYTRCGEVEDLVAKVRPSVRKFHSSEYLNALATGEICFVGGFSDSLLPDFGWRIH
jgi:spermidine/putrescine-binding protein